MNDVPDDLVTVAVLPDETRANLAKNQLGAAGINAYLDGAEAVAMSWHMTGAFGGVKVQVAASDADDARALLEKRDWQDAAGGKETAIATRQTLEKLDPDEEEPLSEREKNAHRAVRAAVFGLLFPPLEAYAALLLLKVVFSEEKLEGRARRHVMATAGMIGAVLLGLLLLLALAMRGPARPKVDLRAFPHPEAMVGTWEGTYRADKEEIKFILQINGNGTVHCWESGVDDIECKGTWGFDNWTFYVAYDRFLKGDSPLKGQIRGYPVEDFQGATMLFITEKGKVRAVQRP